MEYGLVALWLALYLLIGYVGATAAGGLFPRFADRGAAFGVPVALTLLWVVTYVVGRVSLTAGLVLGLVTLVGAAALAATRGRTVDGRAYAEAAAVFSVAFLFVVYIRALDPAIVPLGGEKFLDFGLLQSLLRTETLPPEDMWFAGESVAYYYGGHLMAAILARLTGTEAQYAYNLALAGFYAILVTAAYGLAGAVAADRGLPRRLAAGLSAVAVGFASNLTTPARALLWLLPESVARPLADATGYDPSGLAAGPDAFSYWDASRVIADDAGDFVTYEPSTALTINEFPLFAWLNGDLHAHMVSTGFLLLAAALCFSYSLTPATERRRRLGLLFGVLPLVGALIAVTNTWSFPSVAGLAFLTVALAPAPPDTLLPDSVRSRLPTTGGGREASRIAVAAGVAVGVAALGLVWSLPFWLGAASGRELAVLPDRSGLRELLAVHGLFVVPFGLYLYAQLGRTLGTDRARIVGLLFVAAAGFGAAVDLTALGLVFPLLLGAWLLARSPTVSRSVSALPTLADGGDRPVGFEAVLLVAGAGLVVLVEFVFVRESIGRMNTVFKTYMQVWVLWGVAVGPAMAWLLTRWRPDGDRARALTRTGTTVLVVGLLCATSVYGALALSAHGGPNDGSTLDGLAHLDEDHPGEAEAIRWLDREVDGRPTMVTAAPAGYRWEADSGEGASAPASLTGIPTVAGWFHEAQYRNDTVYDRRVEDVRTIYTGSPERQQALIDRYDVRYIYIGPAERATYDDITVESLDGVTAVHRSGDVVIYRVDG